MRNAPAVPRSESAAWVQQPLPPNFAPLNSGAVGQWFEATGARFSCSLRGATEHGPPCSRPSALRGRAPRAGDWRFERLRARIVRGLRRLGLGARGSRISLAFQGRLETQREALTVYLVFVESVSVLGSNRAVPKALRVREGKLVRRQICRRGSAAELDVQGS